MAIVGCGLCTGIVSQILFTNMTFFQLMFPTKSPEFTFPLVIVIPQVVGQIMSIKYVNQLPFKCGESGLIIFQVCLALILPFSAHLCSEAMYNKPELGWYIVNISLGAFMFYSVMVKLLMFGFVS
jgi:hypothetical protein